jgi:hypothetical protein
MAFFKIFKKKNKKSKASEDKDSGLLVFENTTEVIRAEKVLKGIGCEIRLMGPPPEIQSGCDLVIVFPLIEELNILRALKDSGVNPIDVVPVSSPLLQPVNLFQIKDYGPYLMVRAANMKLCVEKKTRYIVNISGGGCPDVPYLAYEMVGKSIAEAPRPRDIGHTLCGYALDLAFEEIKRRCSPS